MKHKRSFIHSIVRANSNTWIFKGTSNSWTIKFHIIVGQMVKKKNGEDPCVSI